MSAFAFILAEKANHPVAALCRALGVSRSGFYAWAIRPPSARRRADGRLAEQVAEAFAASRRTYGAPRIHAVLRRDGVQVSRKRVARLMRQAGIEGVSRRRGRRSLTRPRPGRPAGARPGRPPLPGRGAERAVAVGHHLPGHA